MSDNKWHQRAAQMTINVCNFINGQYKQQPSAQKSKSAFATQNIRKYSPADGSLLYTIETGSQADENQAVANATEAFNDGRWRSLTVQHRKEVLYKLADLIEANQEALALNESLDVGKPITKALERDIPRTVSIIRESAEGADKLLSPGGCDGSDFFYHVRRPVGVVGAIIGWNYPLVLAAAKMAPALAMGNSLVLKPSEFSSLSACRLAELAVQAGVPPGVFNVVHGAGASVGDCLARHNDIDLLSFTGSTATGKQMMIAAGQSNMKRVMLECGGKSPYLVFDDCPQDLDFIAADVLSRAFANQGALCIASTRLLIQESIKDRLLPKILEQVAAISPAHPLEPTTSFGALINEAHMEKVLAYIESGTQQGARLIYGGKRVNHDSGGYYVEPAIFDQVSPQQKIAREEIFGPVLSVFTFRDEQQAIKLANDSCFGLAAFAATENIARVKRLGQSLESGFINIIASPDFAEHDVSIDTEPHKQSGFGFEGGLSGLASYTLTTGIEILA